MSKRGVRTYKFKKGGNGGILPKQPFTEQMREAIETNNGRRLSNLLKIQGNNLDWLETHKFNEDKLYLHHIVNSAVNNSKNINIVKLLVKTKPDLLEIKNKDGDTILHEVIKNPNIKLLKNFINISNKVINIKSNQDLSLLHYAALKGNLEAVECLYYKYSSLILTQCGKGEWTVLHCAIKSGKLDIIKFLVEKSPSLLIIRDNDKWSVLYYGIDTKNLEIVKYLVEKNDSLLNGESSQHKHFILNWARERGTLDIIKYLVAQDRELLKFLYEQGHTLLLSAVNKNNLDFVKYLVELGIEWFEQFDSQDNNALSYAIQNGKLEIVKYLVEQYSSSFCARYNGELTILHQAIKLSLMFIPEDFIKDSIDKDEGILITKQNIFWEMMYELIAKENKLLITKDNYGLSVLHYAVQVNNLDLVKYLVIKNYELLGDAENNLKQEDNLLLIVDNNGLSPLEHAIIMNNMEIIKYLTEAVFKLINEKDEYLSSALYYAVKAINVVDPEECKIKIIGSLKLKPLSHKQNIEIIRLLLSYSASIEKETIALIDEKNDLFSECITLFNNIEKADKKFGKSKISAEHLLSSIELRHINTEDGKCIVERFKNKQIDYVVDKNLQEEDSNNNLNISDLIVKYVTENNIIQNKVEVIEEIKFIQGNVEVPCNEGDLI